VVAAPDEVHAVASYARAALDDGGDVIIVGVDKRFAQLVGDRLWWYDANKDARYTPEMVQKRFLVPASQVAEWLALVGDDDALPGVAGIGAKGAAGLVPGMDRVGGGLDQRRRLPRQSRRQRAERRRGHGDALGETAGPVHTDDLPVPAHVAQPAPAFRAAAAGQDGVDDHRLAAGAGPGEFVPHDQRRLPEPGAAGAMQLASADPGRADLDNHLAGGRLGLGDVEQFHRARRREDERLHRAAQYASMVARLSVDRCGARPAGTATAGRGSRYASLQRL